MKYFYNNRHGILIYPDSWFDVFRLWLTRVLHPTLKRTWKGNPYWYRRLVHTLERTLEETNYPEESAAS